MIGYHKIVLTELNTDHGSTCRMQECSVMNCKAIFDAICTGTTAKSVAKYYSLLKPRVPNIIRRLESQEDTWVPRKRGRHVKLDLGSLKQLE